MGDAAGLAGAAPAPPELQAPAPVSQEQGIAALSAIRWLTELEVKGLGYGSAAYWAPAATIYRYPVSFCFMDCSLKACTKLCCELDATSVFASRAIPDLSEPGDSSDAKATAAYQNALASRRKELQRRSLKARIKTLKSMRTAEDATTTTHLGAPDASRVYAIATVPQQMLIQGDFRFFAGFSHEHLDHLRLSGAVHPNLMPQPNNAGRYSEDSVNPLHLKSDMVSMQKFLVLAQGGRIVHDFKSPPVGSAPQSEGAEAEAKMCFENVSFITRKNQDGWAPKQGFPLDWDDHSAICENFYRDVVLGDEREPFVTFLEVFENIVSVDTLASLRNMPAHTLKARAEAAMREILGRVNKKEELSEGHSVSLDAYHAIVDSSTETGVLSAAAKLWATTFASTKWFDDRCVQSQKGGGAARRGKPPNAREIQRVEEHQKAQAKGGGGAAASGDKSAGDPPAKRQKVAADLEDLKIEGKDLADEVVIEKLIDVAKRWRGPAMAMIRDNGLAHAGGGGLTKHSVSAIRDFHANFKSFFSGDEIEEIANIPEKSKSDLVNAVARQFAELITRMAGTA